jgi:hypothetical protein
MRLLPVNVDNVREIDGMLGSSWRQYASRRDYIMENPAEASVGAVRKSTAARALLVNVKGRFDPWLHEKARNIRTSCNRRRTGPKPG